MSGGGYADIATIKRTLEIFDRLGCGEENRQQRRDVEHRTSLFHEEPLYSLNLLPESGHHRPAFIISLQQYARWSCRISRFGGRTSPSEFLRAGPGNRP